MLKGLMRAAALVACAAPAAALIACAAPAAAQWAIGAPGARTEPAGKQRYVFIVFANPLPGREAEFNDWYLNTHLGDLVQLEGWVGAQRFQLQPVARQLSAEGYARGYAVLWDQEDAGLVAIRQRISGALDGGKARKGAGFNYGGGGGGGSSSATYRVVGARVTRPDGKRAVMPPADDQHTPRPGRFMLMEFLDPPAGTAPEAFARTLDARIKAALALPGWMAAQRFTFSPPPAVAGDPPVRIYPQNLVVWETEGASAQTAQAALDAATAAGTVPRADADPKTAQVAWWIPISPYITKDDFSR